MCPNLDSLEAGSVANVTRLSGERSFRRRLMELGLLPGTRLRLVRRADIGGVLVVDVRGCQVTLRRQEAREIEVSSE